MRLSGPRTPVAGRFRLTFPLRRLAPGPYQVSVQAAAPGGAAPHGVTPLVRVLP